MNDKTDFSYTFNVSQPVAASDKNSSDLLAFDACKAYPLPENTLLVRNPRNGKSVVVTAAVFSALSSCDKFRTLEAHAAHLLKRTSALPGQAEDIKRVLRNALNNGLLVSADQMCALISSGGSAENSAISNDAQDAVVVIITWERPEALQRLLDSILKNADPGNFQALHVVDVSRSPENISKNQELVADFTARAKFPASYFGQQQQQRMLNEIIRKIPQHERAVRFLADQSQWTDYWTTGLARNWSLLLSVGKRVVVFDDDSICELYEPESHDDGIAVGTQLREADFFEDNTHWAGFRLRDDRDPIGGHLEFLGLPISAALQNLEGNQLVPASFAGESINDMARWHEASPILVTQCGTLGHPGTVGNTGLAYLRGRSRERMLGSDQKVASAIRNSSAWAGYPKPHFTPTSIMSQITGLDNRHELPPYFPILRGQDRLFGYMLNHLIPDAVVMDCPWAAPHLPMLDRSKSSEDTDFLIRDNFPHFFYDWIRLQQDSSLAIGQKSRLANLVQLFTGLGSCSHQQLAEMYRDERAQYGCRTMLGLHEALAEAHDAPANWQEFLQRGFRQLNADLAESFNGLPVKGTPEGLEDEELTGLWCGFWQDYAEALRAWPEIRAAAGEVNAFALHSPPQR